MEKQPLVFENVTITLPESYRADLEAAITDMKSRRPQDTIDHLFSWAVRFYLDRFQKMQKNLSEMWVNDNEYQAAQEAISDLEGRYPYNDPDVVGGVEILFDEP